MTTIRKPVDLDALVLGKGSHAPADLTEQLDRAACVMEAVAFVAGEPWTDTPRCASPVLTNYAQNLNDVLPDDRRQALKPYIPQLIGTRDDGLDERRGYLALDWLVRVYTPAWLRLVPALVADADALAGFRPIEDLEAAAEIGQMVRAASTKAAPAWDAARAAAGAAAWDAAGAAAWDAARTAAGAAAWAAAGDAARTAAGAAAWDAARDAAGDAAWAAARTALQPTVDTLQQSAIDLLGQLINPETKS